VGSPAIVIDAGLGVTVGVDLALSRAARLAWQSWRASGAEVYAPQLWLYEVVAVLRKGVYAGTLDASEAEAGIATALALGVTLVAADDELCRSALRWAERLGQIVAYDGFYLALANRLQADFWTTDRRLVHTAQQAGIRWAHWIGELEATDG
jgi:predicted nucleic acid-binding protein